MTTQPLQFAKRSKRSTPPAVSHGFTGPSGRIVPGPSTDARHEKLVTQAEKWVAQTFYGQLLKQMRQSPFKSKIFSGGRGGEVFGEMFDQQLADRMSKSTGGKLVDAIVRQIEGKAAYQSSGNSGALSTGQPDAASLIGSYKGVG